VFLNRRLTLILLLNERSVTVPAACPYPDYAAFRLFSAIIAFGSKHSGGVHPIFLKVIIILICAPAFYFPVFVVLETTAGIQSAVASPVKKDAIE
jgi:hypothetical protein